MTWITIGSVILGILSGYYIFPIPFSSMIDTITNYALLFLLFGVGIELGRKEGIWKQLKKLGFKIFLVPLGVISGTLLGSAIAGYLLHLPMNESLAIGSGFGWYSISGVILSKSYNVETGTLAFMTNLMRELLTILSVSILAKKLSPISAIAPGGATTMDTTLPLISRATNSNYTLIAFINGVILSFLVPFLVPFFIQF